MPEPCEKCNANPVEILRSLKGSDLSDKAKLVAILEAWGITDRDQIEADLEAKASTIRDARRALKIHRQKSVAVDANDGFPAPEIRHSDGNPSKTTEIRRQNSSDPSRAHATKESLRDTPLKNSSSSQSVSENVYDATAAMVADVLAAMGPLAREAEARKWLTGTIAAYGAERTARAWTILTAKRAAGQPIPSPLALWSKTALGLKDAPPAAPSSADVLPFKVTVAMHPNARPRDEVMAEAARA